MRPPLPVPRRPPRPGAPPSEPAPLAGARRDRSRAPPRQAPGQVQASVSATPSRAAPASGRTRPLSRSPSTPSAAASAAVVDTSPGGRATGECLPETALPPSGRDDAVASAARALAGGGGGGADRPRPGTRHRWRRDGWWRSATGEVVLAYRRRPSFHRTTVTGQSGTAMVERLLVEHFGRPTRLLVDESPAAATGAEEPGRAGRRGPRRARARHRPDGAQPPGHPRPRCASSGASWSTSRSWSVNAPGPPAVGRHRRAAR